MKRIEGGDRCHICYESRLDSSAQKAEELVTIIFASALTLKSKENATVNEAGYVLCEQVFAILSTFRF